MHIICRSIMWVVMAFYTVISSTASTLIIPLYILVVFSGKEGNWKEVYTHWKEMAFVGIEMMGELKEA